MIERLEKVKINQSINQSINQLINEVTKKRIVGYLQHDGFFHLVSGTLFLGFIGPIVEAAFGSLGFLGIYILGGAFGNLLSFIQTQDITVGGTVSAHQKQDSLKRFRGWFSRILVVQISSIGVTLKLILIITSTILVS